MKIAQFSQFQCIFPRYHATSVTDQDTISRKHKEQEEYTATTFAFVKLKKVSFQECNGMNTVAGAVEKNKNLPLKV